MDEKEEIIQQLSASKWYEDEASKLLNEYRTCQTMRNQAQLIPKLESMLGKIRFQTRELKKYLPNENI